MDGSTDSKTPKRGQRTAAQWRSIIARHEASGLSCAVTAIGRSAF